MRNMPYYFIIKKVHGFNYYLNQTSTARKYEFRLEGLLNNASKFTKWNAEKYITSLQLHYPTETFELKPE